VKWVDSYYAFTICSSETAKEVAKLCSFGGLLLDTNSKPVELDG